MSVYTQLTVSVKALPLILTSETWQLSLKEHDTTVNQYGVTIQTSSNTHPEVIKHCEFIL